MAKPAYVDIAHGEESWDVTVNDNFAIAQDGPIPIFETTTLAALIAGYPPASFTSCLAIVHLPVWTVYMSDGVDWVPMARADYAQSMGLNGAYSSLRHAQVTSTAGAITGASVTFTGAIPAGSIVFGVTTRVTTTFGITGGLTAFNIGDGTTVDMFAAGTTFVAGDTTDLTDHKTTWSPAFYKTAGDVVLTAIGGTFDGTGEIRIDVAYLDLTPPSA